MLKHALVPGALVGGLYGCALARYTTWFYEDLPARTIAGLLCGTLLGLLLVRLAGRRGSPASQGLRAGAWVGLATGLPLLAATNAPTFCRPKLVEAGLGAPCALAGALFGGVCGWLLGQMRSGWLSPLLILWCLPAFALALSAPRGPSTIARDLVARTP